MALGRESGRFCSWEGSGAPRRFPQPSAGEPGICPPRPPKKLCTLLLNPGSTHFVGFFFSLLLAS